MSVNSSLNENLEKVLNGVYIGFEDVDYDGNFYWVKIEDHSSLSVVNPLRKMTVYELYFGRDEYLLCKIADLKFFEEESKSHILNQMSQIILHWISKTRIKKPNVKGYDIFNTKEDTMTNMTKAELEQKYWEAQRRIDEYERERDRFLKDIDERDQSISDLIDANEKLSKENDKLSVDISREKDKHDTATEECKRMAKDVEFWKGKAYEKDKKNCELRSRNRELEKENKNCKGMLDTQHEHIKRIEEENVELNNALEVDELKARKNWINSRFGRMGYFDTDMAENLRKDLRMVNCVVENILKPNGYSSMYAPFSKHPTELEMYKALLRIHEIIEEDIE